MFRRALLLAVLALPTPVLAQHPEAAPTPPVEGEDFAVYDSSGRVASFADVLAAFDAADAVLVGEEHDDMIGHGVEAQLLYGAAERLGGDSGAEGRPVVLSLEMFERDVQYIVDEYLDDLITEDQFLKSTRPWDDYEQRYRPLIEFSKSHGVAVVAANAPRRYVNRVTRLGAESLDALSSEAKRFLPPLPYPQASETMAAQWNALMSDMRDEMRAQADSAAADAAESGAASTEDEPATQPAPSGPNHSMGNALQSQALWDAAMGNAVTTALDRMPSALVIHMAGSFHVERGTGIIERVAGYRPGTRVTTVVMTTAENVLTWDEEEHGGLGDFVILTKKAPETAAEGG
jgi:uncharacterized iron-regulated protein